MNRVLGYEKHMVAKGGPEAASLSFESAFPITNSFDTGTVVSRGRQYGIVIGEDYTVPIRFYNAMSRDRADVLIDDLNDIIDCGLPGGDWVIQCGKRQLAKNMAAIGLASCGLMLRVQSALTREADACYWEYKYRSPLDGEIEEEFRASSALRLARGAKRKGAHVSR
jgi:hypothetical protein